MSRARHAMKKASGGIAMPDERKGGEDAEVMASAKKDSAKVEYKDGGCVEGGKSRLRLDRPGRKTGGRVFSDPMSASSATAPMSAAAKSGKDT